VTNQELTDAYRRVTEQFKDLQLKVQQQQRRRRRQQQQQRRRQQQQRVV